MSIIDRGIRGNIQNPFNGGGDAGTIGYSNPRLPQDFNGNVQLALDAAFDYMFPNYKATVDTPADLPATGSTGDYYIVKDDGDGKPAGYVWAEIGGLGSWNKRYDVDWSYEGLLSDALDKTSSMYPAKYGSTDRDAQGNEQTGDFAGQTFYGGNKSGQNMILYANIGTTNGRIYFGNDVAPLANTNIGAANRRFGTGYFANSVVIGNMTVSSSLIETTDAQVNVAADFGAENYFGNSATLDTLKLEPGKISDTTSQIDFAATNLVTTGAITAGDGSKLSDFTFNAGSIETLSSAISFRNKDLNNIGSMSAENLQVVTQFQVGNILANGDTIDSIASGTNLRIQSNGGGTNTNLELNSDVTALFDFLIDGQLTVLQSIAAPSLTVASLLTIQKTGANSVLSTASGDLVFSPAGAVVVSKVLQPATDTAISLGTTTKRFQHLYLASGISDGTTEISSQTLQSLRDINVGVTNGMSLFWDAANNKWSPSLADTEIDHRTIGHLTNGDAGHTQFAMLVGRTGGQTLAGGTAASQNLTLDSTSNATKGLVLFASVPAPVTDNATDLGSASRNFKDLYTLGVHKNLRFESFAGPANYPTNSGQKTGRAIFDSSTNQLLVDTGTAWAKIGQQKWLSDLTWDGTQTTQTVDVSAVISDARQGIWQLADNTNGFERVYAKLTFTQTQVTITVSTPLPAGSYRLIGLN